jgi:hypothetical protein
LDQLHQLVEVVVPVIQVLLLLEDLVVEVEQVIHLLTKQEHQETLLLTVHHKEILEVMELVMAELQVLQVEAVVVVLAQQDKMLNHQILEDLVVLVFKLQLLGLHLLQLVLVH